MFSSFCATYGNPSRLPITEESLQSPIAPYGASKLFTGRMLSDFEAAHGLKWIALRYFNAAGAGPDTQTGESHDPETHLIPLALERTAITVFGTDYDTPDGTRVRNYVHVSDIADAHVIALKALLPGAERGAHNLGLGRGFSVLEVIREAGRVTGLSVPIVAGLPRPGDPAQLVSDATKARSELDWRAADY